ncbi:MAG: hypothetical protein ACTSX6_06460 [Candidatus Heimdallarchaeaceae archaeon]
MKSQVTIALIAMVAVLSVEAILLNMSFGQTVSKTLTSKEVKIIHAINQIEAIKTGLPYALEYSFYQAYYDISKIGGCSTPQQKYRNLPVWRKYDETYEPDFIREVEDSSLSYLNQYVNSINSFNEVKVPSYSSVELKKNLIIIQRKFVCCSPCSCSECQFIDRGNWRECKCNSYCDNSGAICFSTKPNAQIEPCIPKQANWYLGKCPSSYNSYSIQLCDASTSSDEEACKNKCKNAGYEYLSSTFNGCKCEKIKQTSLSLNARSNREIVASSDYYTTTENSSISTVVNSNIFKLLKVLEDRFINQDRIKDKLTETLSSFSCDSDNETVKAAIQSKISELDYSDENISITLKLEKILFKSDCNSTVAVAIKVSAKDKLTYPVYDGTTDYRSPVLNFYIITSSDYSFKPF